ncbi:MAG: TonB-dependent receptor [Gammaproteobacteria bacterium]
MKRRLAALLAALALPDHAAAQVPDPIVVTASRVATPESELARSITVIDAGTLRERGHRTLDEALEPVPGLHVARSGGPGQQTSVFMRGTESNHVLVLLDGMRVGDPSNPGGGFDFASLDLSQVERIEVVRGTNSVLYGSDAIGGTINIITRAAGGPPGAAASVEAGSFDTFNQQAGVHGSAGATGYRLDISHRKTRGYSATSPGLQTPPVDDDGNENWTAWGRLAFAVGPHTQAELFARYEDDDTDIDLGDFASVLEDPDSRLDSRRLYLRGGADQRWGQGSYATRADLGYTRYRRTTHNDGWSEEFDGDKLYLDVKTDYLAFEEHLPSFGATLGREAADTVDTRAHVRTAALYVQDQFRLAAGAFGTVGARLDHHQEFGDFFTFQLAPAYRFDASASTLKASLGSGYRAPSLSELYSASYGNPDLQPERSLGWDAGLVQDFARGSAGVTYFAQDIRDLIGFDASFRPVNEDSAETSGWEAFVDWQCVPELSARLDYTYTHAVDGAGDRLLRRPRHKADLAIRYAPRRNLVFRLTGRYLADMVDVSRADFDIVEMPDYAVVDANAEYRFRPGWVLFARIDNLLDERYEPVNGFQGARLSGYLGVRYDGER